MNRHYTTAFVVSVLILVTACTPQRLQSARLVNSDHGHSTYDMTGFTDLGETKANVSVRHIEKALSEACPAGVEIVKLHEAPASNGFGNFTYWEATARCK